MIAGSGSVITDVITLSNKVLMNQLIPLLLLLPLCFGCTRSSESDSRQNSSEPEPRLSAEETPPIENPMLEQSTAVELSDVENSLFVNEQRNELRLDGYESRISDSGNGSEFFFVTAPSGTSHESTINAVQSKFAELKNGSNSDIQLRVLSVALSLGDDNLHYEFRVWSPD